MGYNIKQYEMGDPYSNGSNWSNANGYNKADSFFNAIGDATDLKKKWEEEIGKVNKAQERLDSVVNSYVIPITTRRDHWQNLFDTLNAVKNKSNGQLKDLENYRSQYKTAERDLREALDEKALRANNLASAKGAEAIVKLAYETQFNLENTKSITDAKIEIDKNEADSITASRDILAKQGLTPEAVEAKLVAEGKTASKTKTFLIGGVVLLIGIFGVIILKRRN
jgi:hypothetical protein